MLPKELIDVLLEVYRLASERGDAQEQDSKILAAQEDRVEAGLTFPEESKELKKKDEELENYLHNLDVQTIKIVQAVMWIGREPAWGHSGEVVASGKEEQLLKSYVDQVYWNDKWQAVGYITSKAFLHRYLREGLRVLNIRP